MMLRFSAAAATLPSACIALLDIRDRMSMLDSPFFSLGRRYLHISSADKRLQSNSKNQVANTE
jgi:hypothetical protein